MKPSCPNLSCSSFSENIHTRKDGFYSREDDSRTIQRYYCKQCRKRFSTSTHTLEYNQKKRRVNIPLLKLLCSKVSIRRSALILGINKNTVLAKTIYLAKKSNIENSFFLNQLKGPISHIQFDDLITKEQTKMKPLSITIAVDVKSRAILAMKVSQIGAFGHLAKKAVKRYGKRKNNHFKISNDMLAGLTTIIDKNVLIETDEHKRYPDIIKANFPMATHKAYKGEQACVVGQGELKKNANDPLFVINHTCAMLRDNVGSLVRRSWGLSQKAYMLQHHLDIFQYFYNKIYLKL